VIALTGTYLVLPAPGAQGALTGRRVEIYRNAEMRVVFSQRMDHVSVERAWRTAPAVRGRFRWEGNMVIFKPDEVLEKGDTYELEISEDARNGLGKHLKEPFRQTFVVLDYPEVATTVPANNTVVRANQTITVLFDHPVRTLSINAVPPEMLRLEPAVPGALRWLGTSGFEFVPAGDLPAATTLTATVPKGTAMADGSVTLEDRTWSFSTAPVQVSIPSERERIKPTDRVRLAFNYPVSPQAVREALQVIENPHGDAPEAPASNIQVVADPKDPTVLLVSKTNGFVLGRSYRFTLPKGFTAGIGPNGLPTDVRATVRTYDATLQVTHPPRMREQIESFPSTPEQTLTIRLNNPIPKKLPPGSITVSPAVEGFIVDAPDPYTWESETLDEGTRLSFSVRGRWKPSTTYTLTLNANIADIFGQKLGSPQTVTIESAPYHSEVLISTYAENGVMAGHLPRLYQLRSMNAGGEWKARVCSGTAEEYMAQADFSCALQGETTYKTAGNENEYVITDIDLDFVAGTSLPVGFYRLDLEPLTKRPAGMQGYERWEKESRSVAVIDTALTLKDSVDGQLLVWATDLKTGEPVPNLSVKVYQVTDVGKAPTKPVNTATTDAQGVAMIKTDGEPRRLHIVASSGAHLGYADTDWTDGISPWSYGLEMNWGDQNRSLVGHLYTDRRVYRSDHVVQFKGVLRTDRDAALSIPTQERTNVTITNPNGDVAWRGDLGLSAFGTFWGDFRLDVGMPLGAYSICAQLDNGAEPVCGSFDVREYRKPDFQVEIQVPQTEVVSGPEAAVTIHGEYYHGAPLSGATAHYTVVRSRSYFNPTSLWREWYNYTLDDGRSWCFWYCRSSGDSETVLTGSVPLDAQGNAILRIPTTLPETRTGMLYTINVTVEDLNARTVSGYADMTVHPASRYVGVRANYDRGWNSPDAEFDVVTVGTDGALQADIPVTVTLSRRKWKSIKKEETDGSTSWQSVAQDTTVDTRAVTTGSEGKVSVNFGPQPDGLYVAKAEIRDAEGRTAAASSERYLYRSSYEYDGLGVTDDRQMRILQRTAEYQPGDTASLAVQSPYQRAKALVTVERDSIRSHKVVTLDANHQTVEIPIGDGEIPNVFVSVLAVQGGGEKGLPDFKLGYAQLQVATTRKALALAVSANQAEYRPGETASLTVRATLPDGTPAQAEVSIAVVDERVVDLLGPIDKDILGKFYFPRRLGVSTAQSLVKLVKKVFFETTPGGAGKGGDSASPIRGNFLDTAYWKADVITGPDGTATVQVPLPDNLTNWQVLAIGTTKDTVVGSAETAFKTRRTLMAEPLFPRILRQGDAATLGATLHNGTGAPIAATASLDMTGADRQGGADRRITIPANGRVAVYWPVTVGEEEAATKASVTVRVSGNGLEDGFAVEIPILTAASPDILGASGVLDETVTETVEIPVGASEKRGSLDVTATPSLAQGLQGSMEYLLDYTYGCAEQTTSAMLAGLTYVELAKTGLIQVSPEQLAKAEEKVNGGIARLRAMQSANGGFGFWSAEDTVYLHLSGYVFWGLTRAEQAGFTVDQELLSRADTFLRGALEQSNDVPEWQRTVWHHQLGEDERAQVIFTLSTRNSNGLDGFAQTLYERREHLSTFGKSFLAMAIANIQRDTTSLRAGTLLDEIRNRIVTLERFGAYVDDGNGYGYFMNSNTRSTAIAFMALQVIAPNDPYNERLLRYLLSQKRDGYWESTQSTAISLLALSDYAKAHPVDAQKRIAQVFADNERAGTLSFPEGDRSAAQTVQADFPALASSGRTHQIGIEKDGGNKMFYDVVMKTFRPFGSVEPVEQGFTLLSSIHKLDDVNNATPLTETTLGENVRIHLKVLVPKQHDYVAVEYHLPAGLEGVDFTLNTSPKEIAGQQKSCAPGWDGETRCYEDWELSYWWANAWTHTEYRDDRIFLFAENLEPGVYEYDIVAQAITPGVFRIPAAQAYEFYHPEVRGTSAEGTFRVRGE
jgi:uncharacterized protein YfaS (alpha-2-macroglobulin family)